jgi:hypothetical protein
MRPQGLTTATTVAKVGVAGDPAGEEERGRPIHEKIPGHCSRHADFAHPLTCGVLAGEQCDLAGVPDDHEQSGADRGRLASAEAATACGGSYRELYVVPGPGDQRRRRWPRNVIGSLRRERERYPPNLHGSASLGDHQLRWAEPGDLCALHPPLPALAVHSHADERVVPVEPAQAGLAWRGRACSVRRAGRTRTRGPLADSGRRPRTSRPTPRLLPVRTRRRP